MHLHLLQLGRIPYAEGLRLQDEIVAARKAGAIGDTLLLMEHPPVLTLGRNATRANILATDELLARKGVEIHETNRGGDVTYHGPGQLVGYPIFDLRGDLPTSAAPSSAPSTSSASWKKRSSSPAKTSACPRSASASAPASGPTPAAAVQEKKIAAIGIHVSQAITSHGFALNVTTDLRDFDWIVPCGIADRGVTSLELESPQDPPPTLAQASNSVAANFGRVFNRQVLAADSLEQMLALMA